MKTASQIYYEKNKHRVYERKMQVRKEMREYIAALKTTCEKCGGNFPPYVLDFHHKGDKIEPVSKTLLRGSWKKLLAEIAKCEIICANCHRIETWGLTNGTDCGNVEE